MGRIECAPSLSFTAEQPAHMREAMRPAATVGTCWSQKKAGCGAPAIIGSPTISERWSRSLDREQSQEALVQSVSRRQLFDEHAAGADWSAQVWQFLTLELWMKTFMDWELFFARLQEKP